MVPNFCAGNHRSSSQWDLDIGCSRHMTWDSKWLNNIKKMDRGTVTFGIIIEEGLKVLGRFLSITMF